MSKHLSLSERIIIESMLNKDFTFTQIAKKLNRTAYLTSNDRKPDHSYVAVVVYKRIMVH